MMVGAEPRSSSYRSVGRWLRATQGKSLGENRLFSTLERNAGTGIKRVGLRLRRYRRATMFMRVANRQAELLEPKKKDANATAALQGLLGAKHCEMSTLRNDMLSR